MKNSPRIRCAAAARWARTALVCLLVGGAPFLSVRAALVASNLRCEYLVNPTGIDEVSPRLSWVLASAERGERQTAYQILVSSTPEGLASDQGDLWDSGRVTGDATAQIVYQGAPLGSRQTCYWKVRSWNQDDEVSAWSAAASWTMGLLQGTDWSAKWIDGMVFGPLSPTPAATVVSAFWESVVAGGPGMSATARVKSWIGGGNRLVKLTSAAVGGDPASGVPKQLRVVYERGGQTLTKTFRENSLVVLPEELTAAPTGLVITGARYEAPNGGGSRDVTERLTTAAAGGPFSLVVNNTNFGPDPAPGRVKQLTVVYAIDGKTGSVTLPENRTLQYPADLPPPGGIVITSARYEAFNGGPELDVTENLTARIQDGAFSVLVNNANLAGGTDIAPNQLKRLRVAFTANGVSSMKFIRENQVFTFPDDLRVPENVPYLRKSFLVAKPVKRATLYATALGTYELRLNGRKVGDHWFAPGWTDFSKRLRYQAYDVTSQLVSGENVLGAQVSGVWYSGNIGNGFSQFGGGFSRGLMCQLEVTYTDGTVQRTVSDASWKMHASPTLYSDLMEGEDFDARQEVEGWDEPGFDDSAWHSVVLRGENSRLMNSQAMEPVRELTRILPVALTEPAPGRWTFDLGQNMVGVFQLKVNAPAGTRLTIRPSEMLNPDGTVYTISLRGAPARDTYICRGGGEETWQPKFTYHGFRYVEVTGLPSRPAPDAIVGVVLGSDTPQVGEFTTSDPWINQLQSNIWWGQRGNYFSVPTDCPQRNERMGWLGDAQAFIRTATYNADVAAFFTKWMVDVNDGQVSGAFPDIAPYNVAGRGSPGWGDAGVICPWVIYETYGDTRILSKSYANMVAWVEWCRARTQGSLRKGDRGNDFGDWLSIDADTDRELIGTAFYAHSVNLVAKTAAILGNTEDAAKYAALFETVRQAFTQAYFDSETGVCRSPTQCAYALALQFDLLPADLRPKAAQRLEENVIARGNHLSTGFLGVAHLLPSLTNNGKNATALALLQQDTFPSWLFSVKQGATTIWERWDGWTPTGGFQDPSMNSFNHYAFGSCGEWLYHSLAGIDRDPSAPGFRRVVIRPRPGGSLRSAAASLNSISGKIESRWSIGNGGFALSVLVPANVTATVFVPASNADAVRESGNPAAGAPGVSFLRREDGNAVFAVASGRYAFQVNAAALPGFDEITRDSMGRAQVSVSDLLLNDGTGAEFVAVDSTSAHGADVTVTDGVIVYRPRSDRPEGDSFSYTIRNADGGIETRTVNVAPMTGPDGALRALGIVPLSNGAVSAIFRGVPHRSYRVIANEGLGEGGWQEIATRRADEDGNFEVVDQPPLPVARFYRAVYP